MTNREIRRRSWKAVWEHPLLYLMGGVPLLLTNWLRGWVPLPTPWGELASAGVWVLAYPMTAVGAALLFRSVYRGEQPTLRLLAAPYLDGRLGQILAAGSVLHLPTLLTTLLTRLPELVTTRMASTLSPGVQLLLYTGALLGTVGGMLASLYLTLRFFSLPYQLGARREDGQTQESLGTIVRDSFAAGKGLVSRQIFLLLPPIILVLLATGVFLLPFRGGDRFAFQPLWHLLIPYRHLCYGGLAEEVLLPDGRARKI